jgi:hypothetical protein
MFEIVQLAAAQSPSEITVPVMRPQGARHGCENCWLPGRARRDARISSVCRSAL